MAPKSAADTDVGKFTTKQAEDNGWRITKVTGAKTLSAAGPRGNAEVLVEPERWIAEKTVDDHLITAGGDSEEAVLEAIRSQQASIDNGIRRTTPLLTVENDQAGNDNEGIASVLPELKVNREQLADNTGQAA